MGSHIIGALGPVREYGIPIAHKLSKPVLEISQYRAICIFLNEQAGGCVEQKRGISLHADSLA
jgi:hypothetical protein|tara:strand:+ start:842 stop:1030 length:189 start_codon:yes stop_codon:yes gene_type:complete